MVENGLIRIVAISRQKNGFHGVVPMGEVNLTDHTLLVNRRTN